MIGKKQFEELLQIYPVLLELPTRLRREFSEAGQPVNLASGRALFDVGTPCTLFLFIAEGSVRVVRPGPGGREVLLYRLEPGEICFLTLGCLLQNSCYVAKGIIDTDLTAVGIPSSLFFRMLDESAGFRSFVLQYLTRRMLAFINLVSEISFGSLLQRTAALLLSQGTTINTTHQKLADELGSTREAISRTLENLQDQGAIRLSRGQIEIVDAVKLEQLAIIAR